MIFSKFLVEIPLQICFNYFIKCTDTKLINAIHICVFTAFSLRPENFFIFKFCFIQITILFANVVYTVLSSELRFKSFVTNISPFSLYYCLNILSEHRFLPECVRYLLFNCINWELTISVCSWIKVSSFIELFLFNLVTK